MLRNWLTSWRAWLSLGVLVAMTATPIVRNVSAVAVVIDSATAVFRPLPPTRVLDTRVGIGTAAAKPVRGSRSRFASTLGSLAVAPGSVPSSVGSGPRPQAGSITELRVRGVAGVSASASAVALNVTVTDAAAPGFVQLMPTGGATAPGMTSNVNVEQAGQTIANLVIVKVGASGGVSLYTQSSAHLVADILGFFEPAASASAGRFVALTTPSRLLDTRDPDLVPVERPGDRVDCTSFASWSAANQWFWTYHRYGDIAHLDRNGDGVPCETLPRAPSTARRPADLFKLGDAGSFRLPVTIDAPIPGGDLPTGASAVVLNLTATQAGAGFVQVFPTGGPTPAGSSSSLNVSNDGQTISNLVVVPIGADGTITIYSQSSTHIVADIAGYFTGPDAPSSNDGLFTALDPSRLVDTRAGVGVAAGPLGPRGEVTVQVTGNGTLPVSGVAAAFINVTMTDAAAPGFVQVFPTGEAVAGATSNLNVEHAGQTRPAAVFARPGAGGEVTVFTQSGGHLVADVAGYFSGAPSATSRPAGERLALDEEFNGSSLDGSLWSTCYWWATQGCTIETNNELEWYVPSQVSVRDGALHLRADAQPIEGASGRTFPYRSGMISSFDSAGAGFSFTYGRVEARVRVPGGAGLWPAVWLLPVTKSSLPEIDIMEVNGANPRSMSTHLHYRDASGAHDLGTATASDDLSGGWHTMAIDWAPGHLVWFADGREVWRVDGALVPSEPMYVIANLAVGGEFVGDPAAATFFPSEFLIDAIRVWTLPT